MSAVLLYQRRAKRSVPCHSGFISTAWMFRLSACILLSLAARSGAQSSGAVSGSVALQRHYDEAQKLQAAGNLESAAKEYRLFIADVMSQLAVGMTHAGQYKEAVVYFDEASTLAPSNPSLQLEYADAALLNGDLERANKILDETAKSGILSKEQQARLHLLRGRILGKKDSSAQERGELEQAVALDPTFENGYELAVTCLNIGDNNCAAKIFAEMSASFGDSAQLHMYFGRAYANSDFQKEAVAEFQRALSMNGRLPGAHYSLAASYLATSGNEKLALAIKELKTEIVLFPKNATAYAALGHLEANQHDLVAAEKHLSRAVALNANDPDTFLYLGQVYAELKRVPEAIAALRTSIQLTSDPSRNHYQVQGAHYLLGRLLMQAGDSSDGMKELEASQALLNANLTRDRDRLSDYLEQNATEPSQSDADAKMRATIVAQQRRQPVNPEAQRQVEAFQSEITPAVADSYNNLGAISASGNDLQTALKDFEQAAAWNPAMEGLDQNLGKAAFALGDFKTAIPPLTRYVQTHPADTSLRSALGLSQFILKDYNSTLTTLRPIEASPDITPQVAYAYAESLVEVGKLSEGIERLKTLETRTPKAAAIHRALGEALARSGNTHSAIEELREAIQLNPLSPESFDILGNVQLGEGDTPSAIVSFEQAVKLDTQNSTYHLDLAQAYRKDSRTLEANRELQIIENLRHP